MKTRSYNFFSNPLKAGLTAGTGAFLFSLFILGGFVFFFSSVTTSASLFSFSYWSRFLLLFTMLNVPLFFVWAIVASIFSALFVPPLTKKGSRSFFIKSFLISLLALFICDFILALIPFLPLIEAYF